MSLDGRHVGVAVVTVSSCRVPFVLDVGGRALSSFLFDFLGVRGARWTGSFLPLNHDQLLESGLLVDLAVQLILESVWLVGLDELGVLGEELDDLCWCYSPRPLIDSPHGDGSWICCTHSINLALLRGDDGDDINGGHFSVIFNG